jgi:tripartite-type tricarboxylate transporter receptor subunit TctC
VDADHPAGGHQDRVKAMTRGNFFRRLCVLAWWGFASLAVAQDFPARPVRLIVPYPAGGATDVMARIIAQKLSSSLGQQFVVDNRPGAGAIVGTEIVARSAADGYTLLMGTTTNAIGASLYAKLPYDFEKDLAPVGLIAAGQFCLVVHPAVPVNSVKELVALAKARPGQLNFASSGNGGGPHLAIEMLKSMAGVNMFHVPYKGAAAGITDLLAGAVQLMAIDISLVLPHMKAGKLKGLAVSGAQRSGAVPELPTVAESGYPGYEVTPWYGLLAAAGTPHAVIAKLNGELAKVTGDAAMREKLLSQGIDPVAGAPQEFARAIHADIVKYAKLVKSSGAKVD